MAHVASASSMLIAEITVSVVPLEAMLSVVLPAIALPPVVVDVIGG